MTFKQLVEAANERGFSEFGHQDWFAFREMRNRTAHAYSEPQAKAIAEAMPQFLAFARDLAVRISAKQAEE